MSIPPATILGLLLAAFDAREQTLEVGKQAYEARCVGCHGSDGAGGAHGPGTAAAFPKRACQLSRSPTRSSTQSSVIWKSCARPRPITLRLATRLPANASSREKATARGATWYAAGAAFSAPIYRISRANEGRRR
ncbi:MAG: hypothetical protein DMF84_14940 [Acidobacteria bacterium]|nr:MAG: hypothetical protein DMF84_14940 [Acidobacteriota bacterium]